MSRNHHSLTGFFMVWLSVLFHFSLVNAETPCVLVEKSSIQVEEGSTVKIIEWKRDEVRVKGFVGTATPKKAHCDARVGDESKEFWLGQNQIKKTNLLDLFKKDPCGTVSEFSSKGSNAGSAWVYKAGCSCVEFEMESSQIVQCQAEVKPEVGEVLGKFCSKQGDYITCIDKHAGISKEHKKICESKCVKHRETKVLKDTEKEEILRKSIQQAHVKIKKSFTPGVIRALDHTSPKWIPFLMNRSWNDADREYDPELRPYYFKFHGAHHSSIILYYDSLESLKDEKLSWIEVQEGKFTVLSKGVLPFALSKAKQDWPQLCYLTHLPGIAEQGDKYIYSWSVEKNKNRTLGLVQIHGTFDGEAPDQMSGLKEVMDKLSEQDLAQQLMDSCQKLAL